MKKFLALLLFVVLVFTISACGSETTTDVSTQEDATVVSSQEADAPVQETSDTIEWKEFLSEYEAWVDQYIVMMKKYKENPSDLTLLADYSNMMTEMADWAEKTEKMQVELENASSAELAEYSAALAKIAAKIAQAAY